MRKFVKKSATVLAVVTSLPLGAQWLTIWIHGLHVPMTGEQTWPLLRRA
jgi:hypothetical protein